MPSLTGLGALSTRSLASLRPRPVTARTTLITWIFWPPAPERTTSNEVFSSAAAPSPAAGAAPGAATATGAAALTPHSSSSLFFRSTSSRTLMLPNCSTSLPVSAFAILFLSFLWCRRIGVSVQASAGGRGLCAGFIFELADPRVEDSDQLAQRRGEKAHHRRQRPGHRSGELGSQHRSGRKRGELNDLL